MRSVRCDACGKRALLAASQCPHCGHLFELRDSFGELLPLAHCATCDSDYPLERGECRWCGTKPEGVRLAPLAWKAGGIAAFLLLGIGAWFANRDVDSQELAARLVAQARDSLQPADTPVVPGTSNAPAELASRVDTPTVVAGSDTTLVTSTGAVEPPPVTAVDSVLTPAPLPLPVSGPRVVEGPIVRQPTPVAANSRATSTTSRPRRVRWVRVVARSWIPVRAKASPNGRVLAAIGPDTRVEVTAVQEQWIRLRTRGLAGWVERRHFFAR
jgi:hypothetical protein